MTTFPHIGGTVEEWLNSFDPIEVNELTEALCHLRIKLDTRGQKPTEIEYIDKRFLADFGSLHLGVQDLDCGSPSKNMQAGRTILRTVLSRYVAHLNTHPDTHSGESIRKRIIILPRLIISHIRICLCLIP